MNKGEEKFFYFDNHQRIYKGTIQHTTKFPVRQTIDEIVTFYELERGRFFYVPMSQVYDVKYYPNCKVFKLLNEEHIISETEKLIGVIKGCTREFFMRHYNGKI